MIKLSMGSMVLASALGLGACGSDSGNTVNDSPFTPKPECEGAAVEAFQGSHAMVFSKLAVGTVADGFDLNGDGEPNNKLAAISSLAQDPIDGAFDDFSLVLPMEFFDLEDAVDDECVKFAMYQGLYRLDRDADDKQVARDQGDCNDHVATIFPGAVEVAGNGMDDDCDGLADETEEEVEGSIVVTASTDESDADGDGVSLAAGDCDDTNADIKPGLDETCGDGLDNDCDGAADWTIDASLPACSPFDEVLDPISIADESFGDDGEPQIAFKSGTLSTAEGGLKFSSGPSAFSLSLPVVDDVNLELRITGTTIEADMVMGANGYELKNGRLGGVLDTYSMDQVRGLDVEEIGLRPQDSFADALYANALGVLLGLRRAEAGSPGAGCLTPDIDVDEDGLEAFCDTSPDEEPYTIDMCVDGDGTVIMDEGDTHCTEALDEDGKPRFVDGISVAITFETVAAAITAD